MIGSRDEGTPHVHVMPQLGSRQLWRQASRSRAGSSAVDTGADLERLALELGPNHAPMAYLGAVLGLRWDECAGLRVRRVDFLRSTLAVAKQITRGHDGVDLKTAQTRLGHSDPRPTLAVYARQRARRIALRPTRSGADFWTRAP